MAGRLNNTNIRMSYWYDMLKGSDELPFLVVCGLILKINRKKCGLNLHICRKSSNFAAEKRGNVGILSRRNRRCLEMSEYYSDGTDVAGECRDTIPTKWTLLKYDKYGS
jgi:hypothetical protein